MQTEFPRSRMHIGSHFIFFPADISKHIPKYLAAFESSATLKTHLSEIIASKSFS